jgi:hypothetical protein
MSPKTIHAKLPFQLTASGLTAMQDQATALWHTDASASFDGTIDDQTPASICLRLHHANFDLWHTEDRARNPLSSAEAIVVEKHNIDRLNQQRNDLVEAFDRLLLDTLQPADLPNPNAPLNSETPGLMLDRLSILALKIYHTQEEIERGLHSAAVPADHAQRNRLRLTQLLEQRADLAGCLDALWRQILSGERRFKLYRQLKMYNDPDLNPVLYAKTK